MLKLPLYAAALFGSASLVIGDERATLINGDHAVCSLAFSPNGNLLAVGATNGTLSLWDVPRKKIARAVDGFPNPPTVVAFSGNSTAISVHTKRNEDDFTSIVQWWNVDTGVEQKKAELVGGGANRAISGDGKFLITVGAFPSKTAKAWQMEAKKTVLLEGHGDFVHAAAVTADGTVAATAARDRSIRLWELPAGKQRWTVTMDEPTGKWLAFSPNGKTLAIQIDAKHVAKLLDAQTGKETAALPLFCHSALPMVFSPDGHLLAFCGREGNVHLWELAASRERSSVAFQKHDERAKIEVLAFSSNSRVLAVGGSVNGKGVVRLYDLR